jgi:hypothetical protein
MLRFHPLQRRELIHVTIIAADLVRRLGGERGMGEKPEPAKAVIHTHQHHALSSHGVERIDGSAAVHHRAPMNPHHHGQRTRRGSGSPPDVQREAIF